MTTHEFAEILQKAENKPLFIQESYDVQGESYIGYSNIIGLSTDTVEEGYTILVDYLAADPNDTLYEIGDAFVTLETAVEGLSQLFINRSNLEYLLFGDGAHYYNHNLDYISFTEQTDEPNALILNPIVDLVTKGGFQPTQKAMTLDEAKNWMMETFPEIRQEYSSENS